MFQNQRFITKGIVNDIPFWLQNLLWHAIETMEVAHKDYLQVFQLSAEEGKQKIIHTQEQPCYEHTYLIATDQPITAKIFVIDDQTHSTMLLAEEY